jgi:hypothetical protein
MTKNAVINGVIVAAAVVAGVAVSMKPWQVYKEQKALADHQVVEMRQSEKKYEELVRQEARLRSDVGKQEMARKRGYLPQGEVPAPK